MEDKSLPKSNTEVKTFSQKHVDVRSVFLFLSVFIIGAFFGGSIVYTVFNFPRVSPEKQRIQKPAGLPGGVTAPSPTPVNIENWEAYSNDEYDFKLRYPPEYFISLDEETIEPEESLQDLVYRFALQDKRLARSATANLQSPQFLIEIFSNSSQVSLKNWLQDRNLGTAEWEHQDNYVLDGKKGIRVNSELLISPNEWIYVSNGDYIFKFTPRGNLSTQILSTFDFL